MPVKANELKNLSVEDGRKFLEELDCLTSCCEAGFYFCVGVASVIGLITQANEDEAFDEVGASDLLKSSFVFQYEIDMQDVFDRLGVSGVNLASDKEAGEIID